MSKRAAAIVLEAIPVVSAVLSWTLILAETGSDAVRRLISIATVLAFLGFVFFFIGRGLAKGDKAVKILGIFDWLATLSIIALYAVAFMVFGL